ncbi:MAG: Nramp family divalent metal transporter [Bifidobacterium longum]|nr:Nramp family divalent metal transporter [Bifidobacterium longum]
MAVTHTEADATAATTMTNAVADIEQETPEIEKERQLAGVGTGAGAGTNNKEKPHDHALASILGPAFVAAVAYVDPGNVAANITSGARYGYLLVWVLVLANAMSVLIQYQSAKLGIVTNKSLPELLGERMSDAGRFMFFMQAEVIAIATDLAEVIGGAIALNLLFGFPLFIGGLAIGVISTVMLWFQGGKTQTTFERIIIVMLLIITFGFIAGLFVAPPNPGEVVKGMIPRFQGADSVLMAASILGATVMPHAIYLHSTLVNDHYAGGLAANSLHGMSGTDSIDGAQRAITQVLGPVIGTIFSIGLLASSLSSTSVGTYAGSEIMHGLLHVNAPMWACRVVTLVPALIVLWFAKDPTQALVIGQVVLSIGIPFAVIPLMRYTHNKELMGKWADGTVKHVIFMIVVALIVALNVLLIVLTLMGRA